MDDSRFWTKSTNLELLEFLAVSRALEVDVEWFRILRQKEIYNDKWHAHRNVEIHFILEGSIQFFFENSTILVTAGSAIVIPARMQHRLYNSSGEQFYECVLNCGFQMIQETPEGLFISKAFSRETPFPFLMDEQLSTVLRLCAKEDEHRISGFVATIECYIMLVLLNVAREVTGHPPADYYINERVDLINMRAKQILQYISEHPRISLRVQEISENAGLSVRQTQRIISAHCGVTVSSLVRSICLKRAKELLKMPSMTITAATFELDFSSEQAFTRFFCREEGTSPNAYRRSIMPPPERFTI